MSSAAQPTRFWPKSTSSAPWGVALDRHSRHTLGHPHGREQPTFEDCTVECDRLDEVGVGGVLLMTLVDDAAVVEVVREDACLRGMPRPVGPDDAPCSVGAGDLQLRESCDAGPIQVASRRSTQSASVPTVANPDVEPIRSSL